MQGDGREFVANKSLAMGQTLFSRNRAEGFHAFADRLRKNGTFGVESPAAGTGARRKGEEMQVAERKLAHEVQRLFKFAIGLAGEAGHDVCAESEHGAGSLNQCPDFFFVMPGTIAAVHAAQDRI